jgi:natural product precursor
MNKFKLDQLKSIKVLSKEEQKNVTGGTVVTCICGTTKKKLLLQCNTAQECAEGCYTIC